jgi:transposase
MARDRTALAEGLRDEPAAGVADARDRQRHLLCHAGGLPVAPAAKRPGAMGAIYCWFANWRDDGSFERLNHALAMADRERVGRNRRLTKGFEATIDSARAFAYAASVTLLVHRIARAS